MTKEIEILNDYLKQKGLKQTSQREKILRAFLSTKSHISADELHGMIRKSNPRIGFSTVYRTLNILRECGLAREVNFGDGRARFERAFDKSRHGHLICTSCGNTEEFSVTTMEKLLGRISSKAGFKPHGHRVEVYGLCKNCR